jgi:hypothetical protein
MATLNNKRNIGLPAPPAPPRRGANPWNLSDTARKPEAVQPSLSPQLFAEIMKRAQPAETVPQAAPQSRLAAKRARPGIVGLVMFLIAATIVLRWFFDERGDGDWAKFIGPLIFIAIVAHGLWRSRQRREENKTSQD